MYSRMAGTGEVSASWGSQILAPPPETGMKAFSMSSIGRGKELTIRVSLMLP
jgi:hypothetical protein